MIKLMEKIWLRAGLDLKMVTYQCVATGPEEGWVHAMRCVHLHTCITNYRNTWNGNWSFYASSYSNWTWVNRFFQRQTTKWVADETQSHRFIIQSGELVKDKSRSQQKVEISISYYVIWTMLYLFPYAFSSL